LRDAILAFRKRAEAAEEVPLDFEQDLLAAVAERRGEEEATALRRFIDHVYHEAHSDLPQWSAWLIAFHFCANKPGQQDRLDLPLDRRNAILEDYLEMMDAGEIEAQLRSLMHNEGTDWDVEIYVRRGWDPLDEEGMPFGVLLELARVHRFQRFTRSLLTKLNDLELERLRTAAADIIARRGVWMDEPLASLPELVEAMP
jgi:hypothetical protein